MNIGGLSAIVPGYAQGQTSLANADLADTRAEDARNQMAGRAAFGRALQMMYGGVQPVSPVSGVGAGQMPQQPMPQQGGGVIPGGSPPMAPQMQPGPAMQRPQMPGMPQQQGGGMPPQGGMPQQQPQMPGGGGGLPQMMQGQLDWRAVIQAVTRANPGAPPQVLAAAVDQFVPMMNMESRMQWQEMRLMLQQQIAEQRIAQADRVEAGRNSREDVRSGDRREAIDQRRDATQTRADTALTQEQGRNERNEKTLQFRRDKLVSDETIKKMSIDERAKAAEAGLFTREQIAKWQIESREKIVETQEAGRDTRSLRSEEGKNRRAELSASTKTEVAKLSTNARREIAAAQEAGRTGRAELSAATRKEVESMREDAKRELETFLEAGRETRSERSESGKDRRADQAEEGRNRRAELSASTKREIATMSADVRREITKATEAGKDKRAELSAEARKAIASMSATARKELQEYLEAGRETRFNQRQTQQQSQFDSKQDQQKSQFNTREARLRESLNLREKQLAERIRASAATEAWRTNKEQSSRDLQMWKKAIDEKYRATVTEIQANRDVSSVTERKRLIDRAEKEWTASDTEIVQLRRKLEGRTDQGPPAPTSAPAGGKDQSRTPQFRYNPDTKRLEPVQ